MADRVYPSTKPNPYPPPQPSINGVQTSATASGGTLPSFPATKSQLYNRMMYRPQPPVKLRQTRRRCCRACCYWFFLIFITIILLSALAGGVFYILYRPQRPRFSVSSLQLTTLNVSASNHLTSKLSIGVTARNPNKNIQFLFDPISIFVKSSHGVQIGDGSFPRFVLEKKNTTVMRVALMSSGISIDPAMAVNLKKSSINLVIDLETKAGVKVGGLKTKKMGVRVYCEGIRIDVPKGNKAPSPSTPDVVCKVKLRIKIWKWTF